MSIFNYSFSSSESESEEETQLKHHLKKNKFKPNNLMKEPKLISIFNLKHPTKIEIKDKIISPFKNIIDLSFAQRDKYIYELGWFLKKTYGDTFKDDWCYFKECVDKYTNGEQEWNKIDPNNLYQDDFNLDVHEFALKVMSKVFPKFKQVFNEYKPFYEIKNKIKYFTSCYSIYDLIENDIKNKFYVNENGTSYIYNEDTKLYIFNPTFEKTLTTLNFFLNNVKEKIEKLLFFISNEYNSLILNSFIFNINMFDTQKKIIDIIKKNNNKTIIFNNNEKYEIAYKDKILNLKDGTSKERTHFDYYTTSINCTYLKNYNQIPLYIRSIFGDDKDQLKEKQILLGSLFTGSALDYFIIFYGEGSNSKSKFLSTLKEIFNDFQLNLDYEKYIIKKDIDSLIETYDFDQKRIIAIDDLNTNTFLKDESRFTRLVNGRHFNFIATTNKITPHSDLYALKRRLIKIEFPYCFVVDPKNENEKDINQDLKINKDFIFTWLVKWAQIYLNQKKEIKSVKLLKLVEEAEKVYDSDYDEFSEEEPYIASKPKPLETEIENPIIKFVKENTIESSNDRINKKTLYEMYTKTHGIEKSLREFNIVIRECKEFELEEIQSHGNYYWKGIKLKDE